MEKKGFIVLLSCLLFFYSCEPSVTVTKDYVTNSDWGKSSNSKYKANCYIHKLIVPDSITARVKEEDFNIKELGTFYEFDSTYCYFKTYAENWKIDTLYFNRPNKDYRWNPCNRMAYEKDYSVSTLGEFERNSWYRLQEVKDNYFYFIYIDALGDDYLFERGSGWSAPFFNH